MPQLRRKRGYRLPLAGEPAAELRPLDRPAYLVVHPESIPFFRPRLRVAQGEPVRIGSLLCEERRNPSVRLLSPGGGRVERIVLGPRRAVAALHIRLDPQEGEERFAACPDPAELERLGRDQVVQRLLAGGLWPTIRPLPFRDLAPTDTPPPAIFVSLEALEPFQPLPAVFLPGQEALFEYGLRALEILCQGRLRLAAGKASLGWLGPIAARVTDQVEGPYPADDPAVVLYHVRRSPDLNRSWTVDPQAVLDIARLLSSGRYPVEHVAAVGGPGAAAPTHLRVRRGSPLEQLARAAGAPMTGVRLIRGGVFRGRAATAGDGLGFLDHALTILPEGNRREFLALFKPGFETPSYSRAFASRLRRAPLGADCNRHGGLRACIACGHCNAVCPVEILPQLAFKAVLARETEEALRHGLLDCVECGLCAFVCPAKIELLTVLQAAKADYRRELEGR